MKCNQKECECEATHVVFWPGRVPPPEMCAIHADQAEQVMNAMGLPLFIEVKPTEARKGVTP